ncbi:MAG: hypothetical protein H0U76_27995 [Ktedonobacteraceae bacterium]|nr:hypothetical protein [Ktedonobacteraceae bacterium]MBA3824705.1 hypothetical protein [Ktedonobacterales bacterium]
MEYEQIIEAVDQAQKLLIAGKVEQAHAVYAAAWDDAATRNDHYQACIVAHFMAHAQATPAAQLLWHGRALAAATASSDERVQAFFPSLYANLAEANLRLGDVARARLYVGHAAACAHRLPDDTYGWLIRSLIRRVDDATAKEDASFR